MTKVVKLWHMWMNVIVMGRKLQDGEEVFTSLVKETNKIKLEISEKKTKFFIVLQKPYNENEFLQLSTYNFVTVKEYTYLGTIPTNENELKPETEKRIANRESYALLAESWTLNKYIAKMVGYV